MLITLYSLLLNSKLIVTFITLYILLPRIIACREENVKFLNDKIIYIYSLANTLDAV
jgi:hypothetical protein